MGNGHGQGTAKAIVSDVLDKYLVPSSRGSDSSPSHMSPGTTSAPAEEIWVLRKPFAGYSSDSAFSGCFNSTFMARRSQWDDDRTLAGLWNDQFCQYYWFPLLFHFACTSFQSIACEIEPLGVLPQNERAIGHIDKENNQSG
ncbi:hypothetical protein AB205_0164760 [Aquarana catesbeiana]|uniref:Uncharacterized protein n=1 Tax=Aquarana catesbeiana TaxID=8400 RepID=A0A2G9SM63_AQUCT|nr:hypothetical protein AB205_0164760 [Aquarana catesbeiana]